MSVSVRASESRIRDANIAEEAASLTKFNILTQSGLAALSQANQSSQSRAPAAAGRGLGVRRALFFFAQTTRPTNISRIVSVVISYQLSATTLSAMNRRLQGPQPERRPSCRLAHESRCSRRW